MFSPGGQVVRQTRRAYDRREMRFRPAVAFLTAMLAFAGEADAADRYAEPGGNGPQASCPQSDPCGILDAVEGPAAQNGDKVLLSPGTYALSETLDVTRQLTIQPADPAAARPVIAATTGGFAVDVSVSQVGLGGVEIRGGGSGGLHLGGGIYGQLLVSSPGGPACYLEDSNPSSPVTVWLNDSTCLNTGGSPAVAAFADDPGDSVSAQLTNVTAASPELGFTQYGIYTQAGGSSATIDLIGTNVIALGGGIDARAVLNNTALTSSIDLDHSNFDSSDSVSGGLVTAPGTGSPRFNQTVLPQFVDLAGRDLHQAPGSPTIDAGDGNAFLLSDLDIDGDPRKVGSAPDIGSDEWVPEDVVVPPADTTAPETTLTRTPRKKVKSKRKRKRVTFAFASSEPNSTFVCTLDGAEKPDFRVVGFQPADEFRAHVAQAFAGGST